MRIKNKPDQKTLDLIANFVFMTRIIELKRLEKLLKTAGPKDNHLIFRKYKRILRDAVTIPEFTKFDNIRYEVSKKRYYMTVFVTPQYALKADVSRYRLNKMTDNTVKNYLMRQELISNFETIEKQIKKCLS